jgi:hypothetical protein
VLPHFNASLFTQVIFPNTKKHSSPSLTKSGSQKQAQHGRVLVRWLVHDAHVPADCELRVCGDLDKLGHWRPENSVPMKRRGDQPYWEAELELNSAEFPTKYGREKEKEERGRGDDGEDRKKNVIDDSFRLFQIRYKYVLFSNQKQVTWEEGEDREVSHLGKDDQVALLADGSARVSFIHFLLYSLRSHIPFRPFFYLISLPFFPFLVSLLLSWHRYPSACVLPSFRQQLRRRRFSRPKTAG